jgi:hypothetical protein
MILSPNRQESRMRSFYIAIVLCAFAGVASAQCIAQGPAAAAATQQMGAAASSGGELIKSASAATHDEASAPRPSAAPAARTEPGDGHGRTGPAMLFAALALMSGIALRRYSGPGK